MKLRDRFFKNRVKPIVITQFLLLIPMAVFVLLSFKKYPADFFYSGCAGMVLATSMFLMGMEQYILKKKSIPFFVLTFILIVVAVQNFLTS